MYNMFTSFHHRFRDRSMLYGTNNPDPEHPSWGIPDSQYKFNFSQWKK